MVSNRSAIWLRGARAARRMYARVTRWSERFGARVPLYRWTADRRGLCFIFLDRGPIRIGTAKRPLPRRRAPLSNLVVAGKEVRGGPSGHITRITRLTRLVSTTHWLHEKSPRYLGRPRLSTRRSIGGPIDPLTRNDRSRGRLMQSRARIADRASTASTHALVRAAGVSGRRFKGRDMPGVSMPRSGSYPRSGELRLPERQRLATASQTLFQALSVLQPNARGDANRSRKPSRAKGRARDAMAYRFAAPAARSPATPRAGSRSTMHVRNAAAQAPMRRAGWSATRMASAVAVQVPRQSAQPETAVRVNNPPRLRPPRSLPHPVQRRSGFMAASTSADATGSTLGERAPSPHELDDGLGREARIARYDADGLRLQYRRERKLAAERGSAHRASAETQRRLDLETHSSTGLVRAARSPSREQIAQIREIVRPLVLESLVSKTVMSSISERLQTTYDRRQALEIDRLGGP